MMCVETNLRGKISFSRVQNKIYIVNASPDRDCTPVRQGVHICVDMYHERTGQRFGFKNYVSEALAANIKFVQYEQTATYEYKSTNVSHILVLIPICNAEKDEHQTGDGAYCR